jgi:hypothetical protein
MRSDVVQIAELAASGQNIHRQALSAKAKSATGSSGCGSFASGSIVVAEPTGCELSKNVVGTREFEAGGIKPSNEGAVLHRNDAVSLSTAIGPCQSDSFGPFRRRYPLSAR